MDKVIPTSGFRKSLLLACVAFFLWIFLFVFEHLGPLDFWWWLSANIVLLVGLSFSLDSPSLRFLYSDLRSGFFKKVLWGILAAVALYFIFALANSLSRSLLAFAPEGIARVYSFRQGSPVRMILLIIFIIGPGEELFWRGFIQRHFQQPLGLKAGWLLSVALYSLVHIGSGNPVLILAAFLCGLCWGGLYMLFRSPLMTAVSHVLWDLLVFVFFPFQP